MAFADITLVPYTILKPQKYTPILFYADPGIGIQSEALHSVPGVSRLRITGN
jgi:hypothetical protein